jgi:RNA polymerase I-specific transcription initiation factor RRN3
MAPIVAHVSSVPTASKQMPSKPLLRRTTLVGTVRSREEVSLGCDTDFMPISSSPAKRARTVTFNPNVEEQIFSSSMGLDDEDQSVDVEAVRTDVKRAIEEHVRGGSEERYDNLKAIFAPMKRAIDSEDKGASNEKLRTHLLALTSCVSLLGRSCSGLVKAILECEWVGRGEGFVKAYVHFLGNLASARGAYVGSVLSMLIEKFTSRKYSPTMTPSHLALTFELVRASSGRLPDCPTVSREQLISRVHIALKYLLRLIPSASGTLAPILSAKFPYSDESKKVHMIYIDGLKRIIEYAPELRSEIFALITERLVKIDVQMQVDFDELDDEVSAAIVQAISLQQSPVEGEREDEDDDSDADSTTSEETTDNKANRIKVAQDNIEKMDAILDTLFLIYTPYFSDPHSVAAQAMFDTLLSHFRNIILPAYRSRHTQFLLFHFAQKSEHLIDTFAGECVDLAFKSGHPAVLKQSAAAYLASFVSRGSHVLPHVVRDVFDYIGTNLDSIREENEQACRGPDLKRYGTFYATTQALLYIFCFRWRDLIISSSSDEVFDDDDPIAFVGQDLEWRPGVKELLNRTIYSKLNPLKICSPPIVKEFARIAHRLNFLYVYPLLETNKRVRLSQLSFGMGPCSSILRESTYIAGENNKLGGAGEESWHQLDAYFPFDPYELPISKRWVEEDYVIWKDIPGANEIEDNNDDSTGEDNEEVEIDEEEVDTGTDEDDDTRV